jgi:protein-tyrosine phosphatase
MFETFVNAAVFNLTFGWGYLCNRPWVSVYDEEKVVLTALPMITRDPLDLDRFIKEERIGHVVNMCEDHELSYHYIFGQPVQVEDWQSRGVHVHRVPTLDFSPSSTDDIAEAVNLMRMWSSQAPDKRTLLHCKAGKGRSVLLFACYLVSVHGVTPDEAVSYIRTQRPQINMSTAQIEALTDYALDRERRAIEV